MYACDDFIFVFKKKKNSEYCIYPKWITWKWRESICVCVCVCQAQPKYITSSWDTFLKKAKIENNILYDNIYLSLELNRWISCMAHGNQPKSYVNGVFFFSSLLHSSQVSEVTWA